MQETYRPLFHEIFTKVNNANVKEKKVAILKQYESEGLKKLLKAALDPNIKWLLPEGEVPYIANEAPEGTEHTRLETEAKKLNNFVALEVDGNTYVGNPGINTARREMMFIQLLEGLCKAEAEVLIAAKDKVLYKQYKGLNANNVREAFGWGENFMAPGVEKVSRR